MKVLGDVFSSLGKGPKKSKAPAVNSQRVSVTSCNEQRFDGHCPDVSSVRDR